MHRNRCCTRLFLTAASAAAIAVYGQPLNAQRQNAAIAAESPRTPRSVVTNASPQDERAPIRTYIAKTWDTLTRSTTDCQSLIDPKVTTEPILYLPADIPEPTEIARLKQSCKVDVRRLPRPIRSEGDVKPEELKAPGLLYLPHPYVVPGGRFNEQYGWDSYFIILGLISDGRVELARGIVDNFLFEIEHYGALLNANRTYYLTRSQPPLLAEMIREIHAASAKTADENRWFNHAYVTAKRDYALWRTTEHRAGDTGLARFFDIGEGPVIEMADDSTYYPDAIRWMLAHPAEGKQYLVLASAGDKASCDRKASHVCATAQVKGMRLTRDFYRGDRAMRESGFDTSFRFGAFSGSTHHFAPVCLNSLLYRYEADMTSMAKELGRPEEEQQWRGYAEAREAAINKYLWNPATGFSDYDFVAKKSSTYTYATSFYPLWAGIASPQQAKFVVSTTLPRLERPFGLAMSATRTGMQWDEPFGWAPAMYFAAVGLDSVGFHTEAVENAAKFTKLVQTNFSAEGTIREKYNVENGRTDTGLTAGYRSNNAGFGWTNGVYLRLLPLASNEVHSPTTP
jgi:alpha,alpha-trehalase